MHREIMQPEKGMEVHHRNYNPLDNRRENLHICTHKENLRSLQKPQFKNARANWAMCKTPWLLLQNRQWGSYAVLGGFDSYTLPPVIE